MEVEDGKSGLEKGGKILGWEGATARGQKKRRKIQIQENKITKYFGIPVGVEKIHLGSKTNLQKLTEDSNTLSVMPIRPPVKTVLRRDLK